MANIIFSTVKPDDESTNTVFLTIEKRDSTFVLLRDNAEFVYDLAALDDYKVWLMLLIRETLKPGFVLRVTNNLGVGNIAVVDQRDIQDLVSKLLDVFKNFISTTSQQ